LIWNHLANPYQSEAPVLVVADGTLVAAIRSEWIFPRLSTIASVSGFDEGTLQEFVAKYSGKEETAEQ